MINVKTLGRKLDSRLNNCDTIKAMSCPTQRGIEKQRKKTYIELKINPMKVAPYVFPMFTAREAESDISIQSSRVV